MTPEPRIDRPSGLIARWHRRFRDAFAGLSLAFRTQESLWVHLAVAGIVIAMAAVLQMESWRWCILLLCISHVIAAEIMNSAIETLIRSYYPQRSEGLADTLHQAAAAVLVSAMISVIIGLIVMLPPLISWLN